MLNRVQGPTNRARVKRFLKALRLLYREFSDTFASRMKDRIPLSVDLEQEVKVRVSLCMRVFPLSNDEDENPAMY